MLQTSITENANAETEHQVFVTFEADMNAVLDAYEAGGTIYQDRLFRLIEKSGQDGVEVVRAMRAAIAARGSFEQGVTW